MTGSGRMEPVWPFPRTVGALARDEKLSHAKSSIAHRKKPYQNYGKATQMKEDAVMFDPVIYAIRVQQTAFLGACGAAGVMATNLLRMMKGEDALFTLPGHRRADELHKPEPTVAKGAAWNDHYGRRSHDVDVEHMR